MLAWRVCGRSCEEPITELDDYGEVFLHFHLVEHE